MTVSHMMSDFMMSPVNFLLLPWELRWLVEDTLGRGISLWGSSERVHHVRLHT